MTILEFEEIQYRKIAHLISGVEVKIPVVDGEGNKIDVKLKGLFGYSVGKGIFNIGTKVRFNSETYPAKVVLTVDDDKTKATGKIIFETVVPTPP